MSHAMRLPRLPPDLSSRLLRALLPRLLRLDFPRLPPEGSSSEMSKNVCTAVEGAIGGAALSACRGVPPLDLWEVHCGGAPRRRRTRQTAPSAAATSTRAVPRATPTQTPADSAWALMSFSASGCMGGEATPGAGLGGDTVEVPPGGAAGDGGGHGGIVADTLTV